ncbi:triacylglycerol esterase/lipase EstA (alpha/beta hydrolase family) [Flavobacterium sp. CG_9.1]|uniref:Alpha/beta hydrolase fold n=1 Tax=Flavobacterium xanthum TaxID=69322 RepID=A0A1M6WSP6_9FLAO|nr:MULTISPECIES: alpha/beta hydrolase [Flavobacterium]MBG6061338.1 triacylglycerol esterase/lipase EstA (alpha/beta hydrolase family) [Flavobacterium sp. CG_9.1]SHK96599.1 alpha/beta hydrolase fold [Flavobacterium xanthum]
MKKIVFFIFTKSIGLYINVLSFILPKKASKLAYSFFSQPREGKLSKKKLPKILLEAQSETFQVEKDSFHTYTWKGNDTVILLVHGWESNASRWKKLLPYLKKSGSTIIAIDGPAHGLSSGKEFNIPQYAAFIHIAVEKFKPKYLIGHSIGGKTCLYYQSVYQNDTLQKMVILGSPSDFNIILNNYIRLLSLNSKILKSLEAHYLTTFQLNLEQFSGKIFASKLNIRGLIAHDIDDTVVLFEEGKKIASTWKNAVFIETKGLGHSMHGAELYKKVSRFLFD